MINKGFDVERSVDGEIFEAIAFVEGNGTTLEAQEYNYTDNNLIEGTVYYYRLKQVDFDGNFEYTEIVTISLPVTAAEIGKFYPNPTTGSTRINYMATTSTDVTVTIFDITGQRVSHSIESVVEGVNTLELNYSTLVSGNYFVSFTSAHGQYQQKLVIQ